MFKNIVSITDLSKDDILSILSKAQELEEQGIKPNYADKVVGSLFFEPSTRTRLSFETAAQRLGSRIIGFTDAGSTSVKKGETVADTIRMVAGYADAIVMRHNIEGAPRRATQITEIPIINAGDGANQHPTQTLLDLYAILKTQGSLENIHVAIVGDLKYGRTTHSLAQALQLFNCKLTLVAPEELQMQSHYAPNAIKTAKLEKVIPNADIIYMTRIQKERFPDLVEYERVKSAFLLKKHMLTQAKENLKILHPLPRVDEIDIDVDNTKFAHYFTQATDGVYVRAALLSLIFENNNLAQNKNKKETQP